jgi:YD repeat-containing protein
LMRPVDEDGWDNSNWWMADDPGNQPGDPPGGSPAAGAANGNFQFSAPVVSAPGRGIDIALSLNYNARVWSKAGNTMSFDAERGYPAPGWNLGFGKMMFMGTSGGCMLIDADGTNRSYTGTITNYSGSSYSYSSFSGHTTDGSFIDYSCTSSVISGTTYLSGSSSLPNGTQISYGSTSVSGPQAFPGTISDAQGNYIQVLYKNYQGPAIDTITDTLGRVYTCTYDSSNRLVSVEVPKYNTTGTRTAIRLH